MLGIIQLNQYLVHSLWSLSVAQKSVGKINAEKNVKQVIEGLWACKFNMLSREPQVAQASEDKQKKQMISCAILKDLCNLEYM